ncbi:MAG: AAA family ATPase, partial [Chloroflexi bacterium]|nr:AAA family ATPase [Chloroflexota bacterium]
MSTSRQSLSLRRRLVQGAARGWPVAGNGRGGGAMSTTSFGLWTVARVLAGNPVPADLDPTTLSEPWASLLPAIPTDGDGAKRMAAFNELLAGRQDAAEIRRAVLAIDPAHPAPAEQADGFITAGELLQKDIPPLRWTVQELLIRPGLQVLAGHPKVGKSWLALQLAKSVSTGEPFLGRKVETGPVLYYALEDGEARLQGRLRMAAWTGHEKVHFSSRLPPLDNGGTACLRTAALAYEPALIIVDSLAAAKSASIDENEAGAVASLACELGEISRVAGCSLLLVHHHRKHASGDPGLDLRGSSALYAALDGLLSLYRERGVGEAKLTADGRDLEMQELALGWTGSGWCYLGAGEIVDQHKAQRRTLDALKSLGG